MITRFAKVCPGCGFEFIDEKDVPQTQEVIIIDCHKCHSVLYIHRCEANVYERMKVEERKS